MSAARRRRDEGPKRLGESMSRVLGRLGAPASVSTMDVVFARWEEVAGTDLADHVRPVRVDGATLVVAAEHPAWATRARMDSGRILQRIRGLGEAQIERVEVVVQRG